MLRDLRPDVLVGSAACGADLLVLEAAGRLRIQRRVLLPFDRETFRATSVADRPGTWGPRFDAVIDEVTASGNLVELELDPNDGRAYQEANAAIFREAEALTRRLRQPCQALVIWDGATRGSGDVTEGFLSEVRRRGWPATEIDSAHPPTSGPITENT